MMQINELYPCGDSFDAYLEYQLICQQCGKPIHIYLPADRDTRSYQFYSNTCHPFLRSIDRGRFGFYPHKKIRITEDWMGGGHFLFDHYHVYPLVASETAEERKARLVRIQKDELSNLMAEHPEKKQWILEKVVDRNENILNALEPILKKYEETPELQWADLDSVLQGIQTTDDANQVLGRLGLKVAASSAVGNAGSALAFDFGSPFAMNRSFAAPMAPAAEKPAAAEAKEATDSWSCTVCGSRNKGKFCPVCGSPSPKLL